MCLTIKEGCRPEFSSKQAEAERQACYREMGLRPSTWRYPDDAVLWIQTPTKIIEMKIAGRTPDSVTGSYRWACNKHNVIESFITIPSKMNT